MVLGRGQARRMTDGAVDVADQPTGAADEVVVVVPDSQLVACDRATRLDAAHDATFGEGVQRVVHGLVRDPHGTRADSGDDLVGLGVGMRVDRVQHSQARAGHPQPGAAQQVLEFEPSASHLLTVVHNLE